MAKPIVECIPNFSEARRSEVIDAIGNAIASVDGVTILDKNSDIDHNRTVITFVGDPLSVEEAAFRAISKASDLIDLNHHQGEHPRIGATDVVPFVPISGTTMEECIEMARRLGQRVGEQLNIPVYLYEEAATRPERANLENIRRGQYEVLKEEIESKPDRKPDFGPSKLTGAGATVIGARHPLIAYNVYLTTDDVSIANKIARVVRQSTGGLRYVKGMGVLVDGMAQVSMNLTNYKHTSMARVVEMIRREANRYGVAIHHSELVGLIPNQALVDAASWYMQMDQFEPNQILETRLYAAKTSQSNEGVLGIQENGFLDTIASEEPTPGGGSVSAYSAAMAASLVSMVGLVTLGKKKYADVEHDMQEMIKEAKRHQVIMREAVQRDADSFVDYIQARRMPRSTDEEKEVRDRAIHAATIKAAAIPLFVARHALDILLLAQKAAELGNINAISDAGSAAAQANAALEGAGLNVRINLLGIKNDPEPANMLKELGNLERQAAFINPLIRKALNERGGLNLS